MDFSTTGRVLKILKHGHILAWREEGVIGVGCKVYQNAVTCV